MSESNREILDNIVIMLDLSRFGEIIAHVAATFAEMRDIDPPDFDGQEMRDLAISSWRHVVFMADRQEFVASVDRDLEKLSAPAGPQHKPEFGFFEPPIT